MRRFEFTPALSLALARASTIARREGCRAIEPRHLLAGLLAEDEGKAATLLGEAGVNNQSTRRLGPAHPEETLPDQDPLPMHEQSREALVRAHRLAVVHSEEGSISSDQVLLAVLQDNPELRQALEGEGLDFPRLQSKIAREAGPIQVDEPLFPAEGTEPVDAARILDANANRAREALRVLEEYARFVLNDSLLSTQLKELRHSLADTLQLLPADLLLQARDTVHDVGTEVSTPQKWDRPSLKSVVEANAKRLQEALRSLEEYGKVFSADVGRALERIRYASYTVERALLIGGKARDRLHEARLYVLVTDALCRSSLVGTVKEALLGGAQVIQLREKGVDDRTLLGRAQEVRRLTKAARALFIVNDRPDIALVAEADGVHLGQEDLAVREARRVLGPDAIIGVSTHNIEQVKNAVFDGATYIGVGPTFSSPTKEFAELVGLEFVRQATALTTLPAFVLGGVTLGNVEQVIAAGASRVAVSSVICAAEDPQATARQLRRLLDAAGQQNP
jgi:thiamine-phosphate pyrophosphorylase